MKFEHRPYPVAEKASYRVVDVILAFFVTHLEALSRAQVPFSCKHFATCDGIRVEAGLITRGWIESFAFRRVGLWTIPGVEPAAFLSSSRLDEGNRRAG
ncbi:hypothetical protein V6C03_13315 [Methyloligella sp. 2.7D]|uniref:hypothetical protein n=1 Tax=Methyloligella sp. 2.7D TaxID=3085160 RepID=UPI00157E0DC0|nr:hypothetical protein HT051_07150 [Methyloligella sp. GL2]